MKVFMSILLTADLVRYVSGPYRHFSQVVQQIYMYTVIGDFQCYQYLLLIITCATN